MGGWISSVSFYRRDKTLLDYMTGRVLRREGANEIVALKDNHPRGWRLHAPPCVLHVYIRAPAAGGFTQRWVREWRKVGGRIMSWVLKIAGRDLLENQN